MRDLNAYEDKPSQAEVELLIRQVDDDLDKSVSQYEFEKCKRDALLIDKGSYLEGSLAQQYS